MNWRFDTFLHHAQLQAIAKRVETLTVKHPIMRDIEVSTF